MQGQEWRKEVQRYLLFRGKNLASLRAGISVSMTHRAPQEADPYVVEPDSAPGHREVTRPGLQQGELWPG